MANGEKIGYTYPILKKQLMSSLPAESYWAHRILNDNSSVHLAILIEPYLSLILSGKKTIESRFSKNKITPFEKINKKDIIILKKSSGPILGICEADEVWYYNSLLTPIEDIRKKYEVELCIQSEEFWEQKYHSHYVTLIKITNVTPIKPFIIDKAGMQAWIVIKDTLKGSLYDE